MKTTYRYSKTAEGSYYAGFGFPWVLIREDADASGSVSAEEIHGYKTEGAAKRGVARYTRILA